MRTGVVVLFFGVAFLLRYLAEHTHVPIEFRLSGVALGGLILLALGWRLRTRRPGYALALQGGGFGVEVVTGNTNHLDGVTTGLYDNTLVQVSGSGITVGTQVEVPSS